MTKVLRGNVLQAIVEALVVPVNTVGVLGGGGLAARWSLQALPEEIFAYQGYCRAGRARLGMVWSTKKRGADAPVSVFFPVRRHWREKSTLPAVAEGLASLRAFIKKSKVKSIAVPALGCGLGGLKWRQVRAEIERALGDLDCDVSLFEPQRKK